MTLPIAEDATRIGAATRRAAPVAMIGHLSCQFYEDYCAIMLLNFIDSGDIEFRSRFSCQNFILYSAPFAIGYT